MEWKALGGAVVGAAVGYGGYRLWLWWNDNRKNPNAKYYEAARKMMENRQEEPVETASDVVAEYEEQVKPYAAEAAEILVSIISPEEFMAVPEERRHICSYFRTDRILAGMDDAMEELDIPTILGEGGETMLEKADGNGLYVKRLDTQVAYEIVLVDNMTYEEAYEEEYLGYPNGEVMEE